MANQSVIGGELRKALRQVQLLETDLWDDKLDPTSTRRALELVRKGQFRPVPDTRPTKPRRPKKPIYGHFTPVEAYAERIAARRDERGWPVTDQLIERFASQLVPHAGRLAPTSAKLWLGGDLRYNWDEFRLWALDTAREVSLVPNDWVASLSISFWPGSPRGGEPSLSVCGLDFETYWRPSEGVVPSEICQEGQNWPGLEVPVFLALNPIYMAQANGKADSLPFLLAPGLRVGSDRLPWFYRVGRNFDAHYGWRHGRFRSTALVRFREL